MAIPDAQWKVNQLPFSFFKWKRSNLENEIPKGIQNREADIHTCIYVYISYKYYNHVQEKPVKISPLSPKQQEKEISICTEASERLWKVKKRKKLEHTRGKDIYIHIYFNKIEKKKKGVSG